MKFKYSNQTDFENDVPAEMRTLYTEEDGVFMLTGIEGIKTEDDVNNVKTALQKEREARRSAEALKKEIDELKKLVAEGVKPSEPKTVTTDDKTSDPTVLALKKELEAQKKALETLNQEREKLAAEKKQLTILEALKKAAAGKVRTEAMSDLELYVSQFDITDDGEVVTENGTKITDWINETLKNKPHWLPQNTPSGASGGPGGNAGDLSLDAKRAKLKDFMGREKLSPLELSEAHKLATEIKSEQAKSA